MATAAKLAANRANSARSTGPNDTSRTRLNGVNHGLTSKQTVIPGESQQEYDTFHQEMRQSLAPGSPVETVLAERVIAAAWRLKRFTRIESAFFNDRIDTFLQDNPHSAPDCALANLFTDPAEMGRMRLFLRYQNAVQREYDVAMRELQKARAERAQQAYEQAMTAAFELRRTTTTQAETDSASTHGEPTATTFAESSEPGGFASHASPSGLRAAAAA